MSNEILAPCPLCDRPTRPDQTRCICGAVLRRRNAADTVLQKDWGLALPWIPLAGALLLLWRIAADPMLQYTIMPVIKIYGVTAISSAMVALLVADRTGRLEDNATDRPPAALESLGGLTPVSWFIAVAAGWPIMFPLFLYVHYSRSAPVRMVSGILTGVFFLAITFYTLFGIRSREPQWPTAPTPLSVKPDRTPGPVQPGTITEPGFAPALPPPPGITPSVPDPIPTAAPPRIPAELSVVPSAKPAAPGIAPTVAPGGKTDSNGEAQSPGVGVSILKGPTGGVK